MMNVILSVDGEWSDWADWQDCTKKCGEGGGVQIRRRSCSNPTPLPQCGKECEGKGFESRKCNDFPCKFKMKLNIFYSILK